MAQAQRYVIVTGGTGGIGAAMTRRWLETGASVLLVGSRQESVDASLAEFGRPSGLHGEAADLTSAAGAQQMSDAALRAFGRPADTLIHLVGGFAMNRIEAEDAGADWERMLALNLTSAFHCYRAAIAGFRSSGNRGWIVGMASRVALQPTARLSAYAASKAGLIALTKSLAAETKNEPITVNVIVTSTVDTAANRVSMGTKHAGAWVSAAEIAEASLYLCSESAKSISGTALEIYGRA